MHRLHLGRHGHHDDHHPTGSTDHHSGPATAAAQEDPQQRITAYFHAADAAAADGWKDTGYIDEYLVPDLAQQVREGEVKNAQSGAVITGKRELSDWTTVSQTDTTATVEFCDDTTGLTATVNGSPAQGDDETGKVVGQFKLSRSTPADPWMISAKNYYPRDTTCVDHFGH